MSQDFMFQSLAIKDIIYLCVSVCMCFSTSRNGNIETNYG